MTKNKTENETENKFDAAYGSKWQKPGDIGPEPRQFQIELARWDFVGKVGEREEKIVLSYVDQLKEFILNATNANALAAAWGKLVVNWAGRYVEATVVETELGPGIRLRPLESPSDTSDIPF